VRELADEAAVSHHTSYLKNCGRLVKFSVTGNW